MSKPGSPPLTRGILCFCCWQMYSHRVHPRSRGEYRLSRSACNRFLGSPPLTRGIRPVSFLERHMVRFTPAHAGNTFRRRSLRNGAEVHPRSRGEYSVSGLPLLPCPGSPPLTRGIRQNKKYDGGFTGFTPAHAGNTPFSEKNNSCYEVHPRSRGEYPLFIHIVTDVPGSPPLTRGIRRVSSCVQIDLRFTPAHAGNTLKKALFYLTFSNTHFHISFNF